VNKVVVPFQRNKRGKINLRDHLDGPGILGTLGAQLSAIESLEKELEVSIQDFERDICDSNRKVIRVETYRSTVLDKETIAVYHTRISARKLQIDTALKMLNKVMPDLKAIENTDDIQDAAKRALSAFASAAAEE